MNLLNGRKYSRNVLYHVLEAKLDNGEISKDSYDYVMKEIHRPIWAIVWSTVLVHVKNGTSDYRRKLINETV